MNREYTQRLEKIEALLCSWLPKDPGDDWVVPVFPGLELSGLTGFLLEPGRDLLERGGKRWRPLLSLLVCEALGGGEAVLPLLPLVEFPHNASLIHDDIEDCSAERRGKPALHLIYGNDTAINSGCFLYFLPLACLEQWNPPADNLPPGVVEAAKNRIWTLWAEHMRRLHLGQSMDIAWHRDPASLPSLEDYDLMCRLKTGCLARFAALLGTAAARFTLGFSHGSADWDSIAERYGRAAEKLGVGFQILDDVKNLTHIPGKQRGDDVVEGKKSLPVLLYLHAGGAESPERTAFTARCFAAAREKGVSAPEVDEFIAALTRAGALEEAAARGAALIGEGRALLEAPAFGETAETTEIAGARFLLAGFAELLGSGGVP